MKKNTPTKRKWAPDEVSQWYQDTGAITYANKEDANLVVKKPRSESWTVNWANPKTDILLTLLFAGIWLVVGLITSKGA